MKYKLQIQEKLDALKLQINTLNKGISHQQLSAQEVVKRLESLEKQTENIAEMITLE